MRVTVVNRVEALQEAVMALNDERRKQDAMHEQARYGIGHMLFLVRRNAPVGQYEPSWETKRGIINHGRPSIRQHQMTLDSAWTQQVERITHGAAFMLYNRAPHALWTIYGTSAHIIRAAGKVLAFWWHKPLRGDPPGPYHFMKVDHPGARPNMYIYRSAAQARQSNLGLLRAGTRQIAEPLYAFFQGRGVRLLK